VSNSDTELELEQAFEAAPQSDLPLLGQNPDRGHFEKHSTMQSTNKSSITAAPQKAQNAAFIINLDGDESRSHLESSQRSLESPQRSLESPQRSLESPQRSLLEEAEAVVARLRPSSSPSQATAKAAGLARRPSFRQKAEEKVDQMPPTQPPLNRKPSIGRKKGEEEADSGTSTLTRRGSLRKPVADPTSSLTRRPSLRRDREESERIAKIQASPSLRRKEFGLPTAEEKGKVAASPVLSRRKGQGPPTEIEGNHRPAKRENAPKSPSVARREVPSPSATPNLRRKGSIRHTLESLRKGAAKEETGAEKDSLSPSPNPSGNEEASKPPLKRSGSLRGRRGEVSAAKETQNRLRGPALSREPSFDSTYSEEAREVPETRRARNRTLTINPATSNSSKTITVNPNNSVNIEIKGGSGAGGGSKKNGVPPSPAASKKTPGATRRSVFAPKPRDDLVACKHCQRNFAEDRVEKHEEICVKTSQKKRKAFDMTKARVKGTDAAKFVKSAAQLKAKEAKGQKQADWRKKREEFINTLRAAKEAQRYVKAGGNLKDLPPPPPMDTSDYIQCPHCQRRFAEAAAERHIPKCKDIKSNKKR